MFYYLTDRESQKDWGFGILANSFKEAASNLKSNEKFVKDITTQVHMPINYLIRHSAELYLKSMIVSSHKFLNLPLDEETYKLSFIGSNGKERKLNNTHWLSELHWYWDKVIENNIVQLEEETRSSWERPSELKDAIKKVAPYDDSSTYFRYPMENKKHEKDNEKFKNQSIVGDLGQYVEGEDVPFVFILKDEDENIVNAFSHDDYLLLEVEEALNTIVDFLSGFHAKTRYEFFGGY